MNNASKDLEVLVLVGILVLLAAGMLWLTGRREARWTEELQRVTASKGTKPPEPKGPPDQTSATPAAR